jgi:HK97 family phage prohead protease
MPNPNFGNIQYKASNGLIKLDELEGIVECFVSGIGNKDSVGDICATGAFAKSLQRRKPRVVWGHNWNDPIGKVLEIYEVPASDPRLPMKMKMAGIGGLYAKVQFNLQSEKGKEAFANVAFFGEEQEWSIGYKTLRAQYDDNLQANVLYEVELYEVSPVLHGANQLTGTISVKSDEEKMHGMMPLVIGAPSAPAPRRDGIFDEGMSQTISGPQLAGVVAELSRRAGGPVMVVNATENSVVFVKPGKGKFRIGYHFTGSEYMFGKPELIHAEQAKPPVQSGPSPMPGIVGKPNKPSTNNPAMPMPVAMKPGNGGMVMVPLPRVEYDGMDKDKKPELVAEERELAESLVRIAGKYGKFDEDGSGIWAGYYPPEKNKVKDIGVKCSNCVLYLGGDKCKILDIKVEAEGKCRFAIIPDGVVVGYGKKEYNEILDEEEIKMVEDIEAKYPGEFILGVLRNTIKKRRRKRRRYKTLEEWGVEEQELMEKGLDPFLAQDSSYVIPVDPTDAFEFKSMIDPVLEYHRIDTFVNEYGVVIASQLDQEAKDALDTASLSAYEFLKKKIAFKEIEEKALGRRIGRAIGSRAIDRPNIGGKKRRSGRGMGVPSGDLDPRTRRDSNLNGILFDNIPGWEQPDPTPDGPGSINNPKPSKRQLTDAAKPDGKEKLSSGARNLRRHADRSADMEKQFPNAEENQKRSDHEAIAKAWDEQGLGWEEVPRYNADDNLSSDYLRGREIGVNQARVMWDGDSVRKRPEKFNEKQKASNEYSNWYSSYAKSVSAYLDAHSRDDSDNWDGIESALRADVKSKYPDTQDWAKEDIATLNEYLNDIGLLDIDKLKKKKKKKAGTETEKGPDLQELRRLNSEGKLSSGDKKKPAPKKDKEKLSSGMRPKQAAQAVRDYYRDGDRKLRESYDGVRDRLRPAVSRRFDYFYDTEGVGVISSFNGQEAEADFIRALKDARRIDASLEESKKILSDIAAGGEKRKAALRRFAVSEEERTARFPQRVPRQIKTDEQLDEYLKSLYLGKLEQYADDSKIDDEDSDIGETIDFYDEFADEVADSKGITVDELKEQINEDGALDDYVDSISAESMANLFADTAEQKINDRLKLRDEFDKMGLLDLDPEKAGTEEIRRRASNISEGKLSSGMRPFEELDEIDKQQVVKNLSDDIKRETAGFGFRPRVDGGLKKFIDDSGDYERGTAVQNIIEDYADFLGQAADNGDWGTLEEHDIDIQSFMNDNPEAHPDVEMEYELDKSDREWADMMSEMRRDLSSDGTSEDEVERILDHWLYSSDSPKQEEYLDEYREPGDNYSEIFNRAAKAMYQDYLERLYDNRQDRNLSSGRRSDDQESRISDREVFERRMAGESLAETAKALGMKREEVRQAEMRHMARERGTLQRPDFDDIETYREEANRIADEAAADAAFNESIYLRRMGGESLADTARELGLSREEVRNREQKHMQFMRAMDREAKRWLDENPDGKFSSGSKAYVSPLDDLEVGQRLSSGKLDEVYRSVQSSLIEQIEKIQESGDGKWEFPWHKTSLPKNVTNNNRPYSGINSVMLMFKQDAMGYDMPLWAGFNQWKKEGGTVRKGEKGTLILIPTILPKKKDADGNEIRGSGGVFFKTGHVFNIDQIDGIDKEKFRIPELPEEERVAELEQALSEVGAVVNTGGDRAFYRPSTDEIHLPPFSAFKSREGYYAVFAHELMHWTGHPSRLNRDHLGEFGSPEYAQEELVAEIASAFFMAAHGLTPEPREDHAQYLAGWLKKLKSDPDAMKKAFGEAQKAHDFAISKSPSMSAKLGKKVAESGILPGNNDGGYGDIGPSLSSGKRQKYVRNPEGTTRTLADEMGAFGDELLTRFDMARGGRIDDRHYFVGRADFGESRASDNEWDITEGENGLWSAALLRLEFNEDSDRDWAGVVSDEYDSPEDVARWISDYEDTRKAWAKKFKEETDFEKISSMLDEETARRDAEYQDSIRIVNERYDRQQYTRMIAEIDESRLEWSAEDWADEASDIRMELAREDGRLSSGVRSRYDETPVETIGTVSNALKRTDEAGSNSRYIASRLAPVPADKYDFDSIRRNGESVSFTYGGKPRTIYPTGMMAKKGGGIYVVGLDDDQGQYRSYSLHKIEGLVDGADAPYNPTQPGVPRGTPGARAQRTRNVTSERLSSGRVRPIDEVRAAVDDFRYGNMVASRALRGEIGREDRNGFIEEISLDQHEEAIEAVNGLAELRDEMIRSMLGGEKMPADSNIFDIEKYADISEDDFNLLQDVDFAIDDIQSRLEFRENESSLLDEQIEDLKINIAELENNFRDSRRIGSIVDFESAMQRHIDDSDGDREEAIDSIRYDAERIIDVLQDIEDIENSFIDSSLQGQIDEIQERVDSIGENTTPEELASNLSGLYYGSVNRLESELSNLFDTQEEFRESGVGLDRKDRSRLPEDIFSASNLSDFDMVEGDAADFLEPGDVPGLSSGRRSRTQGSKRRPMSDADRQAFADGVRQRAATIPGKRKPGPSREEFGTDRLSSGRLRFPDSETRNVVGRYLESKVKIKFGKISENNDRSPDGKWMLDAKKLEKILKDEDGNPLSMEESAKFLGVSEKEIEKMLQDGAGISEIDAYEFIDRAFFGGRDPGKSYETLEAIWGFDAAPYWYDKRRGNLLNRAEYEDYKEEGIAMYPLYAPIDFEVEEQFVGREVSKKAFPVSVLAESLGVESDEDLAEAVTFEVDGVQITPTEMQLKKWKQFGVPTGIIEQLVDRGIIPSAGDVFGEEGVKFDNSIRQFDLWKKVSDAIARNGKKVKGIDLDEVIGATKVQTRLKAFEEGKEGKFSPRVGKALRYSDEEVREIVDRLNKKFGLNETVESIKGGSSMSSGRRAARRISNTGAEAAERLSSGRVNNGAPENITPRMQNEIMGWAENATWSNFAQSLVSQFKAQGFLSATQWTSLLRLHDNSKRRR